MDRALTEVAADAHPEQCFGGFVYLEVQRVGLETGEVEKSTVVRYRGRRCLEEQHENVFWSLRI